MATKSLVAFLTFLLAFGTAPAQLWAEGAEGLAQAAEDAIEQVEPVGEEVQEPVEGTSEEPTEPGEDGGKTGEPAASSEEGEGLGAQASGTAPDTAQVEGKNAAAMDALGTSTQAPAATASDQPAEHAETVAASARVIGLDAEGQPELWASASDIELSEGSTAANLFKALVEKTGLTADYLLEDDGYFRLKSITSPNDGRVLEYDWNTDANWMLYVDGSAANDTAGQPEVTDGNVVTWFYTTYGTPLPDLDPSKPEQPDAPEDKTVSASIEVIGADKEGNPQRWTELSTIELPAQSTAADLSEALFEQAKITADFGESTWGWSLNAITSPLDGRVLGWDGVTQKYWQLFVNGEPSALDAGAVKLKANDSVSWVYSAFGEEKPEVGDIVVNPDAAGPDWEGDWPGYAAAGTATDAKTPTGAVKPSWVADDFDGYLSDPIAVNGRLYVTSGSKLYVKDAATGKTLATARLAAATDSIARMVYADGLVVVPLSGGRLQALTADKLATRWVTEPLAPTVVPNEGGEDLAYDQQALTTLTVWDGCVYFGTAATDSKGSYGGWLACVNLSSGAVRWKRENKGAGYYWAGAASVGDYLVIGGDDGVLQVLDPATGEVKGSCVLGAPIRSTVVAQGSVAYAVTSDGALHRLTVGRDGSLRLDASVDFGFFSTSTPTLAGGKVIVGGASNESYENTWGGASHYGALFIIDAKTLKVERVIDSFASGKFTGDIKSAPLVSEQAGGTYVYFTVNAEPGGVYRYKLGDARAQLIYVPDKAHQNYSMSSIVCDADGNLYYVNDSKALFALAGASDGDVDLPWGDGNGKDNGNEGDGGGSNGGGASGGGSNGGDAGPVKTPAAKNPASAKPAGTVVLGSLPLAGAEKRVADADGEEDAAEEKAATAREDAGPFAVSEPGRSGSAHVGTSSGMAAAALIAGGIGAVGLIAAGLWLAASKRKGGMDA